MTTGEKVLQQNGRVTTGEKVLQQNGRVTTGEKVLQQNGRGDYLGHFGYSKGVVIVSVLLSLTDSIAAVSWSSEITGKVFPGHNQWLWMYCIL